MDKSNLTQEESLRIISDMIRRTRGKIETSDGNLLLSWGMLAVIIGAVVMTVMLITGDSTAQTLWAFMALGTFINRRKRNIDRSKGYSTYIDTASSSIWRLVTLLCWPVAITCLVLFLINPQEPDPDMNSPWLGFYLYAMIVVGAGAAIQGIVIKIKSLIIGGAFSVSAGLSVMTCAVAGITVRPEWGYPLLIACFIMTLIIPGILMQRKAVLDND